MRKDVTAADFAALSGARSGGTYTTIFRDSVTVSQVTMGRNNVVTQHQHVAPAFEELAAAMRHVAELMAQIGLPAPDAEDAVEHVSDVIAETTAAEPDLGRIRRALQGLGTFLQPVADQR